MSLLFGRVLLAEEGGPGANLRVIYGYGSWWRRFCGEAAVIGKTISRADSSFTVIGVLPPGFELLRRDDIFVPLGLWFTPGHNLPRRDNQFPLYVLGRLESGITLQQARLGRSAAPAQLRRESPTPNSGASGAADKL